MTDDLTVGSIGVHADREAAEVDVPVIALMSCHLPHGIRTPNPKGLVGTIGELGSHIPLVEVPLAIRPCHDGMETMIVIASIESGQKDFALVLIGALIWTVLSLIVGVGETEVGADLSTTAPREIYIVSPGDTLWSIATSIDSDGDPRDTVDRLAALNGGSSLYVGQRLVLSN